MKKNIIKTTMIAVVAIFAGYNVYQSNMNSNELSDVMLANVEALADNEAGANGCYPTICKKKCKQYIYESTTPCYCSLCSAVK